MTRDPNRVRDLLRRLRITHIVNYDQRRDLAEFIRSPPASRKLSNTLPQPSIDSIGRGKTVRAPASARLRYISGGWILVSVSLETSLYFRERTRAPCDYLGVNAQTASVGYFAELATIA